MKTSTLPAYREFARERVEIRIYKANATAGKWTHATLIDATAPCAAGFIGKTVFVASELVRDYGSFQRLIALASGRAFADSSLYVEKFDCKPCAPRGL